VVESLVELGALAPVDDMGPVRRSVQFMLDNYMDKPFEAQSIAQISDDLYEIAYDQPFRFPATFTFVMRAFSTLEGVGKGLDPEFNFMEVAKPFATELMTNGGFSGNENGSLFGELGRQAVQVSNSAFSLPRRLEETLDKLDNGDLRLRVRSVESDRILRRLSNINLGTNYVILIGSLTLSATILLVNQLYWLASLAGVFAAILGIFYIRLLWRLDKYERMF
jgi:predicted unusual protein kinase regulating ubiquinone biosynthesis (AarF/ABC1/UbiB family)